MIGIKKIGEDLEEIKLTLNSMQQSSEEFIDMNEAAKFLMVSKSSLYKCTMKRQINFFKPGGKKILFKKSDLVSFIEAGRIKSLSTN